MIERLSDITEEQRKELWLQLVKDIDIEKIYVSGMRNHSANKLWSIMDTVTITIIVPSHIEYNKVNNFTDLHYMELQDFDGDMGTKNIMCDYWNECKMDPAQCVYTKEDGFIFCDADNDTRIEKRLSDSTVERRKELWNRFIENKNIKSIHIKGSDVTAEQLWSIEDKACITIMLEDYYKSGKIDLFISLYREELTDSSYDGFTKEFIIGKEGSIVSDHCVYTREQGFIYNKE